MIERIYWTIVIITIITGIRYVLKSIANKVADSSLPIKNKLGLLAFGVIIAFEILWCFMNYVLILRT